MKYVYDVAGVFRSTTIATVQRQIQSIRDRTGAEIVVYAQVVGNGTTSSQAEADALALMNQWGVGRKGWDDGLVILFDLEPSKIHGQVQLYAGPGFARAYLSNAARQAIFETVMLPLLAKADLDGALLAAMTSIDAAVTPANARKLLPSPTPSPKHS